MIVDGRMHGPGQCPPPPGKRGDRGHSLHPAKVHGRFQAGDQATQGRGTTVGGLVSGSQAGTHRRGKKTAV